MKHSVLYITPIQGNNNTMPQRYAMALHLHKETILYCGITPGQWDIMKHSTIIIYLTVPSDLHGDTMKQH